MQHNALDSFAEVYCVAPELLGSVKLIIYLAPHSHILLELERDILNDCITDA